MNGLKISNEKHVFNVIKNSGPNNAILFREPIEQFNNGSTLIVNPGERALFLSEGKIVCDFTEGSYKLETKNVPLLTGLKAAILSGGISKYTAQIYFIKLYESQEIKFGTNSPILIRDNKWGIFAPIRLFGFFKIRVNDCKTFFEKMNFGNTSIITEITIKNYLNETIQQVIRNKVTKYFKDFQDELIGVENKSEEISKIIESELKNIFANYGLALTYFCIISINADAEKYEKIDQAKIQNISRKIDAKASKEIFDILGDDWEKQKQVEILEKSAANGQNGGILSAIYLGDKIKDKSSNDEDIVVKLGKLKELLDKGILKEGEYENRKKKLLDDYL